MSLKKKPVTGMRDILPAEMQIRDYILNQIKDTEALAFLPSKRPAWSISRTC